MLLLYQLSPSTAHSKTGMVSSSPRLWWLPTCSRDLHMCTAMRPCRSKAPGRTCKLLQLQHPHYMRVCGVSSCVCLMPWCRSFYGESIPGNVLCERIASYKHLFNLYWYTR